MGRALRLLSGLRRARHPAGAARLAVLVALSAATLAACSSDEGCEFAFAEDAVTQDEIPWVCRSGTARPLSILFRPDATGLADGRSEFTWRVTSCRTTALDFDDAETIDGATVDLLEVGGNVAVGRLTFVLDGASYLCGYGVPPP